MFYPSLTYHTIKQSINLVSFSRWRTYIYQCERV